VRGSMLGSQTGRSAGRRSRRTVFGEDIMISRRCERCHGSGREQLPPAYARALLLVRQGLDTATAVAGADGCSPNAAINRLEKLRTWGLVTRVRVEPRGYRYEEKKP
jgi:hypothetical protein